jgi:GTPase SAR1 family protein
MDAEQTKRRVPDIPFRVLIIGRANAGKTSILQRVCETTDSPIIYRGTEEERVEVRGPSFCLRIWSYCRPG